MKYKKYYLISAPSLGVAYSIIITHITQPRILNICISYPIASIVLKLSVFMCTRPPCLAYFYYPLSSCQLGWHPYLPLASLAGYLKNGGTGFPSYVFIPPPIHIYLAGDAFLPHLAVIIPCYHYLSYIFFPQPPSALVERRSVHYYKLSLRFGSYLLF